VAHLSICIPAQGSHAHEVLDETPGNPAAAQRVAGVRTECSASRGDVSNKIPRLGRGTALGCAGRTGARARDLVLGARRVDPVAGLEATAAGASRHGVNAIHLQKHARVDARLLTQEHARRRRAWVKITPRTQRTAAASLTARLAGDLAWSSRGVRWPQPCVSHARPRLARSAQPPGNQGRDTRRSGGARRSLHSALGSKAGDHRWSSHGDGGPGGMDGPRAPLNRGATVLRLEGRQPGKDTRRRTPTSLVPDREDIKEGGKRKMAAVVLTLGRWCSRGRLEDGRWHGEGIHGGVGVHGGVDVLAPVRLLLPTRAASSPLLVAAVVVVVLGAPTASRCGRAFPRLDAAAARLLPSSLSAWSLVKKGKPQWGWWLGRSGCGLALPLKPGAVDVGAKAPNCPGSDRPGGRGSACSLRISQDAGARDVGAKEEVPCRARFDSRACAHRLLGVRVSGRGARPISRARGCGAGRPVRPHPRRGGEKDRRRKGRGG
jgi:hypothetical protein